MAIRFLFCALLAGSMAQAQSVDLKNDNLSEGTTTIEIKKTRGTNQPTNVQPLWEIAEGTSDIQGETSAMNRAAKESWQKACNTWKKEFREDNKENKIINLNCGVPNCGGEAGNVVCTSKSTYKIKTKLN